MRLRTRCWWTVSILLTLLGTLPAAAVSASAGGLVAGIDPETIGLENGEYGGPAYDGSNEIGGCSEDLIAAGDCPNGLAMWQDAPEVPEELIPGPEEETQTEEHQATAGPDSGVQVCACGSGDLPGCASVTVLNNGLQDASPALQRCFDWLGTRPYTAAIEIPPGFYALGSPVRLVNETPYQKTVKVRGVPIESAPCFDQLGVQRNACAILIAAPNTVGWGGVNVWRLGKSIGLLAVEGQDLRLSHVGVHGNRWARMGAGRPAYNACHREGIFGKYKGVNLGVACDRCQFLNGYSGFAACASGLLWTNYQNWGDYRQTRGGMVRANLFTHNGASVAEEVADGATFYSASGTPGSPFYVGLNGAINNSDVGYGVFGARDGAIFEHNGVIQTVGSTSYLYAGFILEARPFRSPAQGFNDFTGAVFRYNWINSSYGAGTSQDPVDFGFQVGADPWFSPSEDARATGGFLHDNHFYEVKQPVNVARSVGVRVNGVHASWISPVGCPQLGVPYGQGSGCSVPGWLFQGDGRLPTSCGNHRHPTSRFNVSPGRGPLQHGAVIYPAIAGSQLAPGSVQPTTYWNWENCY